MKPRKPIKRVSARQSGQFKNDSSVPYRDCASEYRSWYEIQRRCFHPQVRKYEYYGGRGITMCERWRKSFAAFLGDMGKKPTPEHTIDRIDTNGNYEPSNCRWATRKEQCVNRRLRRDADPNKRHLGDENPLILCLCGCGQHLLKFDYRGNPRKRISGHWKGVIR